MGEFTNLQQLSMTTTLTGHGLVSDSDPVRNVVPCCARRAACAINMAELITSEEADLVEGLQRRYERGRRSRASLKIPYWRAQSVRLKNDGTKERLIENHACPTGLWEI